MRILSMCSTWARPDSLLRMLESFQGSGTTEVLMSVYVSENDPKIEAYCSLYESLISKMPNVKVEFGPHRFMVEVLNHFSLETYPNYEYYQEVNDDHIYRTKGWDLEFIKALIPTKGTGLVCGNDLFGSGDGGHWKRWEHPSAAMISGNIVRMLGCFSPKGLRQFGGDIYCKTLFKSAGLLFHLPHVIIEHMSVCAGKAAGDDRQTQVYSGEEKDIARKLLSQWINHNALKQVNMCRRLAGLPPAARLFGLDYM